MSLIIVDELEFELDTDPTAEQRALIELLGRRRSIKRLRSGPFPKVLRDRLLRAIQLTPAAYNQPPWHIVILHERRDEFWDTMETAVSQRLEGDRLQRWFDRFADFRPGVAIALIYEDRAITGQISEAWQLGREQAHAFVQQALGMMQLSLWLALTAEGLATSLQHWNWLAETEINHFAGIDPDRYHLTAVLPIGYPDEAPRDLNRVDTGSVVAFERSGSSA